MEGRTVLMNITSGIIEDAQRVIVYGPEGIGKSTFASKFPGAIFIDTEGSTKRLNVKRFDKPSSWTMLFEEVKYVRDHPELCMTLVIDTADWSEQLASNHICSVNHKQSIEDFGYGKGYTKLYEEFGRLLDLLNEVISKGINVVLTAHAKMRKFEQPDELGAYDRWEMKLSKNVAPIVKEWADTVLFVNYKTFVIKDEKTDSRKAQGGRRVMYTNHHPCWDAKNRYGLPDEVDFDFSVIAPFIPSSGAYVAAAPEDKPQTNALPDPPKKSIEELKAKIDEFTADADKPTPNTENTEPSSGLPAALRELMTANNVTEDELRNAVAWKGYFTADTPILNYGEAFINGCLIGAWERVYDIIVNHIRKF
jgi:hypothetical protein